MPLLCLVVSPRRRLLYPCGLPGFRRSRCQPRIPTAPAPMSGPRSPRRVGVIACVTTVRQAGVRAELLLRGVEERRREAERHAAADDHQVEIEQVAQRRRRPADQPAGALHDLVGRLGRRATGDRLDRRARTPRPRGSRAPRSAQRRPFGSTMMWPTWPAFDDAPSSSSPSSTIPPPMPVDTDHAVVRRSPWPRPSSPRPAPAPCRRARRTPRFGVSSRSRSRSGNSRHDGDVDGRHGLTVRRRPGRRTTRRRPRCATRAGRPAPSAARRCAARLAKCDSGPTSGSTATCARSISSPLADTRPASNRVPLMSMPRTPGRTASGARAVRSDRRGTAPGRRGLRRRARSYTRRASSTRLIWYSTSSRASAALTSAWNRCGRSGRAATRHRRQERPRAGVAELHDAVALTLVSRGRRPHGASRSGSGRW